VLLLVVAGLGAISVFALVAGYLAEVRAQVGPKTTVLRLTHEVKAFEPVKAQIVEEYEVPERWAPPTALHAPSELGGLVAAADLEPGSVLQTDMVSEEPEPGPGQRELAILVDAETGVAGKIGPGSVVDIFATFPDSEGGAGRSEIVVSGARVIEAGVPRPREEETQGSEITEGGEALPVTFALSIRESLVLTHAESFADEVRLGLVRPGEDSDVGHHERVFARG
jgi:pilus assembly protein CpaB